MSVPAAKMRDLAKQYLENTNCKFIVDEDSVDGALAQSDITCGGRLKYAEANLPTYIKAQMRTSRECSALKQAAASVFYFNAVKDRDALEDNLPKVEDCKESCGKKPVAS